MADDGNRAMPVISAGGTIFFAGADAKLYALDSFGTTKWSPAMDGPILGTSALAESGTIFVANGRNLSAVSPDGNILSQVIIGTGAQASLTLAPDGTVYVATYEAKVIAYTGGHGKLMNSLWPKYLRRSEYWRRTLLLNRSGRGSSDDFS